MLRWLLVPALALAVIAAACSGGDDDPTPTATAPTEAPTQATATTTTPPSPAPTETPSPTTPTPGAPLPRVEYFDVPADSRPHDVAPAVDGGVWYAAQGSGELGWLDPTTGEIREIPLGPGSAPHGVIVGPDGAPWLTDGGQNAIVRVDPETEEVTVYPLPSTHPNANLNTAAFDGNGILWFTGQRGVIGRLDPETGAIQTWDSPRGRGPYGIDATPDGRIFYASLAGNHIAEINIETAEITPIDPPTPGQGARRVWADSQNRIWVSEWNSGQVSVYDPADGSWQAWTLPGANPQTYAVYVDERDIVWLSDFAPTPSSASTPRPRSSRPTNSRSPTATSARSSAAMAKSGRHFQAPPCSWSCEPTEHREPGTGPRALNLGQPHQRLSIHPVRRPFLLRPRSKRFVELDGRLVPIQHRPLQPGAAALDSEPCQLHEQRLAVPVPA